MLLTLEPLQASEGDCLLLHWGTEDNPRLGLIDGGPGNTYESSLRPRLEEIRDNHKLVQLSMDLVMVSHVDNDHIVGIKKLFRKLKSELESMLPDSDRPFTVARLWHNTFNDILNDAPDQYFKTLTASLQANVGGNPNPELLTRLASALIERQGISEEEAHSSALEIGLILAGQGEGRELRDSHRYLFTKGQIAQLNSPFSKSGKPTLLTVDSDSQPQKIGGLSFTVLGPLQADIQALQTAFDAYIKKKGLAVEAVLAAYADKSIPNLSSIVCMVESQGKRILLTGDARGDKILAGLKRTGMIGNGALKIDILKVPHHGSDRNIGQSFFETVIADTYVFSGNGKYGNPERDTLDWLIEARGKGAEYRIVLTYAVNSIDKLRKLEKEKRKKIWDHEQDSLEALFKKRKQQGYRFEINAEASTKIELGDESVSW
jgi:beta-lactamase superfamily II metal-dependent hydrolase